MGHYDSCYEADEEKRHSLREKYEKQQTEKIQKMIDEYGIAATLVKLGLVK